VFAGLCSEHGELLYRQKKTRTTTLEETRLGGVYRVAIESRIQACAADTHPPHHYHVASQIVGEGGQDSAGTPASNRSLFLSG